MSLSLGAGHVTAGGSICIEALTTSGSPGAWQPTYTVEAILNVVIANMIDCEVTHIQTLTGPGGRTGPLRVCPQANARGAAQYSEADAQAAFARTLHNHRVTGWGNGGAPGGAGAGPSSAQGGLGSFYPYGSRICRFRPDVRTLVGAMVLLVCGDFRTVVCALVF